MKRRMSTEKKHKMNWVLTLVSFVMCIVLLGAVSYGVFNMPSNTTEEVGFFEWGISAVSEEGKIVESRKAICTKDFMNVNGLEITLEENANITYTVTFYDKDSKFVEQIGPFSDDFDADTIPENAEYFRVTVVPNQVDGEDVIVNAFTVNKYAKQINITYKR